MRLYELALPIGHRLTLKIVGLDYKAHAFQAELLGYQNNESVVLTLLSKPGQVLLHKGLKASVEGELVDGRFRFESEIDEVMEKPFLHLHLEYPAGIEYTQLRRYPRLRVDTPVEVSAVTGLGMKTGTINGFMLDISEAGARIVLEKELTAMVTELTIGVALSAGDLDRNIEVTAKVKRSTEIAPEYPQCGFAYGVEFTAVGELEGLFLRCFCQQELRRGNAVAVY